MEDTCHDQVGALVELRRTPVGCARGSLLLVAVVILAIRSPIVLVIGEIVSKSTSSHLLSGMGANFSSLISFPSLDLRISKRRCISAISALRRRSAVALEACDRFEGVMPLGTRDTMVYAGPPPAVPSCMYNPVSFVVNVKRMNCVVVAPVTEATQLGFWNAEVLVLLIIIVPSVISWTIVAKEPTPGFTVHVKVLPSVSPRNEKLLKINQTPFGKPMSNEAVVVVDGASCKTIFAELSSILASIFNPVATVGEAYQDNSGEEPTILFVPPP